MVVDIGHCASKLATVAANGILPARNGDPWRLKIAEEVARPVIACGTVLLHPEHETCPARLTARNGKGRDWQQHAANARND